ncbi:MAG: histidinol-phosphate aminotransferase [Gaiellaceae bacterium]|nr:histidinol-phosphate aminotransferase [Gaiellaceae bacterium]
MSLRLHGDVLSRGLLDFAVNVWPAPRAPELERALGEAVRSARYPDESRARAAIAARHGRPEGEVLLLNGACEGFWLLAHALRPRHAAVVHPAFTEPDAAFAAVGTTVTRVMREPSAWTFDPRDVPADADVVVVGSPNNPTGNVDAPAVLAELARPGRLVVVDGSFADFVPFEPTGDVVFRSLTKLWSLAGVRAGYVLAPAGIVETLEAHRQPWSVNAAACAALAWCAADAERPTRVSGQVAELRARLVEGLDALGIRTWPSVANFLLLELADGDRIVDALRARGIAVRPCASFPGLDERHVRIAVRTERDNRTLLAALEAVL